MFAYYSVGGKKKTINQTKLERELPFVYKYIFIYKFILSTLNQTKNITMAFPEFLN